MLLRSVLSRFDATSKAMPDRDLVFLFDNHLHYNVQKLTQCMLDDTGDPLEFQRKLVYLCYDEDSLRNRMGCVRESSQFDQIEYLTICSKHTLNDCLPNMKRLIYPGTNSGNKIGDIELPPISSLWQLPCKVKYHIHGSYRVECGGKTRGEEGPGRGNKRKTQDDVEPVFWHGRPAKFLDEIKHSYRMNACIDITPGDGTLAILCANARIPYFGFALNEKHAKAVRQRCIQVMLERKFTEGDKSYDPELAKMFKITATTPDQSAKKAKFASDSSDKTGAAAGSGGNQQTLDEFKKKLEELKKQGGGGKQEEAEEEAGEQGD